MALKIFSLAAVCSLALAAIPPLVAPGFTCGTETTPEFLSAAEDKLTEELRGGSDFNLSRRADLTVNVYFHIVAASSAVADGNIPGEAVIRQFTVMNDRYAPQSISFRWGGYDRTINANWSNDGDEVAMKNALHKGTYDDLNIYILKNPRSLGYCYLPGNFAAGSWESVRDGCTINVISLPRAPNEQATSLNSGIVSVHEVGHWFGLLHTFQGNSCSGPGDYVSDTPQQAASTNGCPATAGDTCPTLPGTDPIHNYMDYSSDNCKTEFTAGQKTRMFDMFSQFRAGK